MSENQTATKNTTALTFIEKHLAIITALIIPVVGLYLLFLLYSYYHGYYEYFKISEIWLDMSSDHSKFYPIFMVFATLLLMAFNAFPILLIKYDKPTGKARFFGGLFKSFVIGIIFLGSWWFALKSLFTAFIVWLVTYGIGFIEGLVEIISSKVAKKIFNKNENSERDFVIGITVIIVMLILEAMLCYLSGNNIASAEKTFKIIDNSTVILCETQDKFIVAEAEINGDILNIKPKQTIIENTDVTYEIKTFAKVNPPKS